MRSEPVSENVCKFLACDIEPRCLPRVIAMLNVMLGGEGGRQTFYRAIYTETFSVDETEESGHSLIFLRTKTEPCGKGGTKRIRSRGSSGTGARGERSEEGGECSFVRQLIKTSIETFASTRFFKM